MIIEHEKKVYKIISKKPIIKGELYFDYMTKEIKMCNSYICYDPWSLKMEEIKNKKELYGENE